LSHAVCQSKKSDVLGLNYNGFVSHIVKAMQEQQAMIEEQQTKIQDQETKIQDQETKIQDQETKIQDQETKIQDQETKINAILLRLEKAGIAE